MSKKQLPHTEPNPLDFDSPEEYEDAVKIRARDSQQDLLQNGASPDVVDVFDALPKEYQKNHALLKSFCHWYLGHDSEKRQDRIQVKRIVRACAKNHPDWRAPDYARLPGIAQIAKNGNYSEVTVHKWIRSAVKAAGLKLSRGPRKLYPS